jgi:uncharacterized membrane protein YdcZ (DUF606 family)
MVNILQSTYLALLFLAFAGVCLGVAVRSQTLYNKDGDDDRLLVKWLAIIVGSVLMLAVAIFAMDAISMAINPDYYAITNFKSLVK